MCEEEFDFEANLAMFDKRAAMQEIDAELANKPDILRLVDCNRKRDKPPEPKFKSDENVLGEVRVEYRQIITGEQLGLERQFVTDSGLVVPAVSLQLRGRLAAVSANHGLSPGRQAELMGRAAVELGLQLLGGGHRLAPANRHQV